MLRNITLSADPELIDRAREIAKENNTTLNNEFRTWLSQYVNSPEIRENYHSIMERLSYYQPERTYTRDEMNER
jgi:hypothetical protein